MKNNRLNDLPNLLKSEPIEWRPSGFDINRAREVILRSLARYQYLTTFQLSGLAGTRNHISNRVLPGLEESGLVVRATYGTLPGHGQLAHLWYLSPKGAAYVADMMQVSLESIAYRKDASEQPGAHDYWHRWGAADLCISLDRFAEAHEMPVNMLHAYFHRVRQPGKAAHSPATIYLREGRKNYITPDVVASLTVGGAPQLIFMEFHAYKNAGQINQQLADHISLFGTTRAQERFQHTGAHLLLSVHSSPTYMAKAMDYVGSVAGNSGVADLILFNTIENARRDFGAGWLFADGAEADFLNA